MSKIYSNISLISEPTDDSHVIKKKTLHEALWEEKTRVVVDSEAYYSLETETTEGVKQVVTVITDGDTQILLDEVNTQSEPVDLTGLVGDGTEYVLYHDEITHEETYEEEKYVKVEDMPEGNILMTTDEFNDLWGEVVVLDYQKS